MQDIEAKNVFFSELTTTLDMAQALVRRLDGTIVFWSGGASDLYGWTRSEAIGRISHELLQAEFLHPLQDINNELLSRGSWTGELKHRRRNGSVVWVAGYWALHRGQDTAVDMVVEVYNDISSHKRAEEALRASNSTVRALFENASQGILTADSNGHILTANAMIENLFGYSRAELLGQSVEQLLPARLRHVHEHHRIEYATQRDARLMGQDRPMLGRRKDGSEFPLEISLSYVPEDQGGVTVAFISDITRREHSERRLAETVSHLEKALAEKTVLLKEIHHRVKNNLAVIASLLGMQADAISDGEAARGLLESQQRVYSMALIHEHLYGTKNLERIRFDEYLEELANGLYASFSSPGRISVKVEAEAIELGIDKAIPCGLIVNELLSNALKYAFPDDRGGVIVVGFVHPRSGGLRLSVQDNGVGLPDSYDWRHMQSLGLQIVQILAKQLAGGLELHRDHGTRFELTFPCKEDDDCQAIRQGSEGSDSRRPPASEAMSKPKDLSQSA